METDLQKNWDESIADRLQHYTATVLATGTVIWAADVGAGTKRRILQITVSNDSTAAPTTTTIENELSVGVRENFWYLRPIPAAGFVQDKSPSWKEPLLSLQPGGNLWVGGGAGFDGYIEVIFYDDHLGL